jgi:hypothetical protein
MNELERVIADLQNEHSRFQGRLEALKATGPGQGFNYEARHDMQKAYLEAKIDYLELLIRRYRGWLK